MNIDREKKYQVYHALLSMVLTLALALAINQYFHLRVPIVTCAFFSFVPALLIYLFDLNRKKLVSYLILLSIFPMLALIFWLKKFNPLEGFGKLINWCSIYNGTEELYNASYAKFLIFGTAVLGTVIFYLITRKQLTKIILAVIIIVVMIVMAVSGNDINKAVVGICIFYFMTIIVEVYGIIYSKKAGKQEKKEEILYLAPACLLLALLSVVMPSKPEPIQWSGVKHIYNEFKDRVDLWITDLNYYLGKSDSEFTVNLTGYSEDSKELGNGQPLSQNKKVALYISGSKGNLPIYLIGSVSNVYTGSSWEKVNQNTVAGKQEYLLDYAELIYALSRLDQNKLHEEQFINFRQVRMEYNKIKTRTFFYPLKSSYLKIIQSKEKLQTDQSNITFSNAIGKGTTYEYTFYEMNLEGDEFKQLLRDSDSFSYDDNNDMNSDNLSWLNENYFYKDKATTIFESDNPYQILKDRAKLIKEQYMALPSVLPDRVKKLTMEITAGYDATYDKLKAIEAYLRQYRYTLHPDKVPVGNDFVDDFLFESQKGYCTAYASAMAIMGRCIGVPTRYVEGFVATFGEEQGTATFPIRDKQAHAWAEAYIEGVGWIPFEATPNYFTIRYNKWKERPKPTEDDYSDFMNQYQHRAEYNVQKINPNGLSQRIDQKPNKVTDTLIGVIIFLTILIILILVLLFYYFILRYQYKKAFEKADHNRRMYLIFLRILYLLKLEGFTLEPQETILMLADRVKEHFHYERITFSEVAYIFMRYRYAQEMVRKEELNQVELFHQGLQNKRREEQSRLRVSLEEFIFLTSRNNR
jgi:transglutaminase-like putative cysteine protease